MLKSLRPYLNIKSAIYFFALIAGWPCVFYLMGWLPNYQINYIVLLIVAAVYVCAKGLGSVPYIYNMLIFQMGGWLIYSFIYADTSYLTRIALLLTTFFLLRMQYMDKYRLHFVKVFDGWILIQVICGTIGMILVLQGILHPLFEFKEMDYRTGYCFGLFTTNTYFNGFVRNAGFFDEPGALAFWGVYALLLNKLFVKNRVIEYILMIGLISTLSMAYFIQLFAYLYIFYKKQFGKLIVSFIALYLVMLSFASTNQTFYDAIFGRFEYNEETGSLNGDNRSDLMKNCWTIFKENPIIGIGANNMGTPEMHKQYGFLGANFFYNWAADGIFGVIITYIPLIFIFKLRRIDPIYTGVGIILLMGYLQRPYDSTQLLYPLMTYTMLFQGYIHKQNNLTSSIHKRPYPLWR